MSTQAALQSLLCEQWCNDVQISRDDVGIRVSLPLVEGDGDEVTIWLQAVPGGWRITDAGTTMMRLSYHLDVDDLAEGPRERALSQIVVEQGVEFAKGELSVTVPEADLTRGLLTLGQAMTRAGDISLWGRQRVATAFYDDLYRELKRLVGEERLQRDYVVPNVPEATSYAVDFAVTDLPRPFYIFGVPTGDKARLATIVLQHLRAARHTFESLTVLAGLESVPRGDLRRLMNVAGDLVDGLDAQDALENKVAMRLAAA